MAGTGWRVELRACDSDEHQVPAVSFGPTRYSLSSIELHTPSEHTIGGGHYDAELQLVHHAEDGQALAIAARCWHVHD